MSIAKLKLLSLVMAAAVALGACGGEASNPAVGGGSDAGNGVDAAFAAQMAEHHEGAIAMAELAPDRARHREVKQLASQIVAGQRAEIEQLEQASSRLEEAGAAPGDLGLSEHESGMDHDSARLADAKPFDRAFIDAMIPHHQGAIRMARVELAKGGDSELKALAKVIVAAQSREIEQMNEWRTQWYGKPSPSGGVPDEDAPAAEQEEHSGH